MPQTSKRPNAQPQLAVVPKTPEGQRLQNKITAKEAELKEVVQRIQQAQQVVETSTRQGINLEGQLVALREELEEVERAEPVDGE